MARMTRTSSRNSMGSLKTQPPMAGVAISWMPKAPRVMPRQFRKTLNEMMANPKVASTKMSSRKRLKTTPTANATRPAKTMPTGSAAKNGRPGVGQGLRAELLVRRVGGEDGHGVGADAKEADMAHGEQAGVPQHQIQTDGQNCPDPENGRHCRGEAAALPYHEACGPEDDHQRGPRLQVASKAGQRAPGIAHQRRQAVTEGHVHRHSPISSAEGPWTGRRGRG